MGPGVYARAALPLIPGASRLPWVAGRGEEIPDVVLSRDGVVAEAGHVAEYARACGFRLRDELPPTYPHVLAFPLHMELMTDGRFPFPAIGLVHIANRITVHRPLRLGEPFDITVRATAVKPHPKGRSFSLVTEARADGELAWEEEGTILRRGGGEGGSSGEVTDRPDPPPGSAEWRLPGDLGRRYAGVSGDRNPIHLHPLTARLLGFPRPIAHGMWTKARCLAALEAGLPDAYTVAVSFRRPILLPGTVAFGARDEGRETHFAVRDAREGDELHLEGTLAPARRR